MLFSAGNAKKGFLYPIVWDIASDWKFLKFPLVGLSETPTNYFLPPPILPLPYKTKQIVWLSGASAVAFPMHLWKSPRFQEIEINPIDFRWDSNMKYLQEMMENSIYLNSE